MAAHWRLVLACTLAVCVAQTVLAASVAAVRARPWLKPAAFCRSATSPAVCHLKELPSLCADGDVLTRVELLWCRKLMISKCAARCWQGVHMQASQACEPCMAGIAQNSITVVLRCLCCEFYRQEPCCSAYVCSKRRLHP